MFCSSSLSSHTVSRCRTALDKTRAEWDGKMKCLSKNRGLRRELCFLIFKQRGEKGQGNAVQASSKRRGDAKTRSVLNTAVIIVLMLHNVPDMNEPIGQV